MSGLGSLSQSARQESLKGARTILIIIGVLTLLVNLGCLFFAKHVVDMQIAAERQRAQREGMVLDEMIIAELMPELIRSTQIMGAVFAVIGGLYLVGATRLYDYPVPITVTALVVYVASHAITALFDPTTLLQGVIIKVLFIVMLGKAVGTAMAYERERSSGEVLDAEFDESEDAHTV